MTDKLTLTTLTSLQNELTALSQINGNNATIVNAFDNTLSRDGTTPNQMGAPLDMNSYSILNLPQPLSVDQPLRLQDLNTFVGGGTISSIPAGGTTSQVLAKVDSSNYHVNWTSNISTAFSFSGIVSITNSTSSSSTITGALVITGGVGVGGKVNVGGGVNITNPGVGLTALSAVGNGNAAINVDYLGTGFSYYDAGQHNFRSTAGVIWGQFTAGTLTLSGGGASGYNQVLMRNDTGATYQFGYGGSTSPEPNKFFIYNSAFGFCLTADNTGAFTFPANVASSSTTTGTVIVTGGVGISGSMYAAGNSGIVNPHNADTSFTCSNLNSGASATSTFFAIADTNTLSFQAYSPAAGGFSLFRWLGAGSFIFDALNAAGNFNFRTGSGPTSAMTIDSSQNILATTSLKVSGTTGGLGYATGAGGTVTQSTNKSTAFTLSKVSGQITLATGSLAADTTVSATWTNTAIAATDVVTINHVSGGTLGAYIFNVQCGAGTATLNIHNATPGALNEQPVLQFVVIKGVNA